MRKKNQLKCCNMSLVVTLQPVRRPASIDAGSALQQVVIFGYLGNGQQKAWREGKQVCEQKDLCLTEPQGRLIELAIDSGGAEG